jgi:nucleoside-diphosphate-sugar epimerase
MVFGGALAIEAYARAMRWPKAPIITRYATWLMARRIWYSTEKARSRLGWSPALGNEESIERTVRWFLDREQGLDGGGSRPKAAVVPERP